MIHIGTAGPEQDRPDCGLNPGFRCGIGAAKGNSPHPHEGHEDAQEKRHVSHLASTSCLISSAFTAPATPHPRASHMMEHPVSRTYRKASTMMAKG